MYKPGQDAVSKDEGELNVAKRLHSCTVKSHKGLIDVVVYDALACNFVWINHCKSLGIDAIVRSKNNNNNNKSLRFAKKAANRTEAVEVWEDEQGFEKVQVYQSIFTMENVEQSLRFVKFAIKHKNKLRTQIMIVTTCMDMRYDTEDLVQNNQGTLGY